MPDNDPLLPAALAMEVEPFTDDDLDYFYDHGTHDPDDCFVPDTVEKVHRWEIVDTAGAEWAMRKFAAYRREARETALLAQEYRRRIDEWERAQVKDPMRRALHMQNLLADYAYRVRQETEGKVKTIKLPSGEVRTRGDEESGSVQFTDKDAVQAWAEKQPERTRMLFLRYQVRPITEIRDSIDVTKLRPHWRIHLDCGHVVMCDIADEPPAWVGPNQDDPVKCPICHHDGSRINAWETYDETYLVRHGSLGIVPGLEWVQNDLSVTVEAS